MIHMHAPAGRPVHAHETTCAHDEERSRGSRSHISVWPHTRIPNVFVANM